MVWLKKFSEALDESAGEEAHDIPRAEFIVSMPTIVQKTAAKRFLAAMQTLHQNGLTSEDEAALDRLDSGEYKINLSRELDS